MDVELNLFNPMPQGAEVTGGTNGMACAAPRHELVLAPEKTVLEAADFTEDFRKDAAWTRISAGSHRALGAPKMALRPISGQHHSAHASLKRGRKEDTYLKGSPPGRVIALRPGGLTL